jgi:chaperonin GroEL
MIEGVMRLMEAGYSATSLRQGIEIASKKIIESLRKTSTPITTREQIEDIGTISANGDRSIGRIIADAMERVGRSGIITIEDAKGMNTSLDIVDGMRLERGYLSPYFVTNNEKMNVVLKDAYVLLTDRKLSNLQDLVPILEQVHASNGGILIVADDVEGDAMHGLILNKTKSGLKVVAIKAPEYGVLRHETLLDMSALTGATLFSNSTGNELKGATLKQLGRVNKCVVDAKYTTLVGHAANKQYVEKRAEELRALLQDVTLSTDDISRLRTRLANISSGVAVIKVGGATELEMIERKYRIEDALHATHAAAEEGIVPGGGLALINCAQAYEHSETSDRSIRAGIDVVLEACYAPLKKIAWCAGKSSDVIVHTLKEQTDRAIGYDAAADEFKDMLKAGIIDPAKVERVAMENAASVTMMFTGLDAIIFDEE